VAKIQEMKIEKPFKKSIEATGNKPLRLFAKAGAPAPYF
jgi:hypothetical protein